MARLPRILIVDDVLGSDEDARQEFCAAQALQDEGARSRANDPDCLARVVFCRGQQEDSDGRVHNDAGLVFRTMEQGWPSPERPADRWALICLDINFSQGIGLKARSTDFGFTLLQGIQQRTDLWGDPENRIPVVMLSTKTSADSWDSGTKHQIWSGDTPRFFEKWTDKYKGTDPRKAFADFLFREALLEDGAWRYLWRGQINPIHRNGPLIETTSPALLHAMRDGRRAVLGPSTDCFFIEGEPGDQSTLFAQYLHDHRTAFYPEEGDFKCIPFPPPPEAAPSKAGTPSKPRSFGSLRCDDVDTYSPEQVEGLRAIVESSARTYRIFVNSRGALPSGEGQNAWRRILPFVRRLSWPPLRDRPDDISRLFAEQLSGHWQDRTAGWAIAPEALAMLRRYRWPGNERELNNVAAAVAEYSRPHRDVCPQEIVRALGGSRLGTDGARPALSLAELLEQVRNFAVDPSETDGAWPLLHDAFGALWRSMLVAAAKAEGSGSRIRSAVGMRIHAIDRTKDPEDQTGLMNTYMARWTKEFGWGEGEQRAVIEKLNNPKLVAKLRDEIEG